MIAIFKRDFKSFFKNPLGYVFLAVNLCLVGIYFLANNLISCYPYFSYTLSGCLFIFLVTIPILTMRSLSEERKNKTDQLILTSPVSVGKIVFGKFLALSLVFTIFIAIISFYPLIMAMFGTVPFKETYVAVFGLFLYGLLCIAIGLFISSLTESQIIAAVLSFLALFLTYLMSGIISLFSDSTGLIPTILSALDARSRLNDFLQGTFRISSMVYLIIATALFLFFTAQSIQKRRYTVSVKNLKMGAFSTTAIVAVIIAAVFANLLVTKIPEKYTVFDVTTNGYYSITDITKDFLKTIDTEVNIYVYQSEDNFSDTTIKEILKRYDGESKLVTVTYIDPITNPNFYKSYSSSAFAENSVVVTANGKSKVISYEDLYETQYSMDSSYNYTSTTTGIDAEGQITSAIAMVTGDESHTIYYTEGHGEQSFESTFTDVINKSNANYESLTLLNEEKVPEDAEMLMIVAPATDFSEKDIEKLREYMDKGGTVLASLVYNGNTPNLYEYLKECGVIINESLVLEANRDHYYMDQSYLLPDINYDTVTSNIYSNYYVFAPYTLAMTFDTETESDLDFTEILTTSSEAYAKDINDPTATYDQADGDLTGPFVVLGRVTNGTTNGTLYVTTSANMFTASASQMVSDANLILFTNVISDSVNIENPVSVPVKNFDLSYLVVTASNVLTWAIITIGVIPLALIIFGLFVWLRRRKK